FLGAAEQKGHRPRRRGDRPSCNHLLTPRSGAPSGSARSDRAEEPQVAWPVCWGTWSGAVIFRCILLMIAIATPTTKTTERPATSMRLTRRPEDESILATSGRSTSYETVTF